MNDGTFKYAGYHFCPYARFNADYHSLEQFFNYKNNEFDKIKYNRNDFYKHSPVKNFNVFKCLDDGLLYVPTNLGLIEVYEPPIAEFCKARMVNDYEIIHSFYVGEKEVIVGEDKNAEYRYFCGYYESNDIFERAVNCCMSNDYLEIMKIYCDRTKEQVELCAAKELKSGEIIAPDMCEPCKSDIDLSKQIVVLKPELLRREYQNEYHQLFYVTGGNGAKPNSIGTKVYGCVLKSGKQFYVRRDEIMGIMDKDKLPEWANKSLAKLERDNRREER